MKRKKYWFFGLCLIFAGVLACFARNLQTSQRIPVFYNLKKICVEVFLSDDGKEAGLLESIIRTDVELKLRRNGFNVISTAQRLNTSENLYVPALTIRVTSLNAYQQYSQNLTGLAAYISVNLSESAYLYRNRKSVLVDSWNEGMLIINSKDKFVQHTRQVIADCVDSFLNDYLAAKQQEEQEKKSAIQTLDKLLGEARTQDPNL